MWKGRKINRKLGKGNDGKSRGKSWDEGSEENIKTITINNEKKKKRENKQINYNNNNSKGMQNRKVEQKINK